LDENINGNTGMKIQKKNGWIWSGKTNKLRFDQLEGETADPTSLCNRPPIGSQNNAKGW